MECPRDRRPLEALALDHAKCFTCSVCKGRALTVPLLHRMMPVARLRELWAHVRSGKRGRAPCPACARPMRLAVVGEGADALQIDGCATCQILWFDPGELPSVAPASAWPSPVLDAPVPADASGRWAWADVFRRANEKNFGGAEFGV